MPKRGTVRSISVARRTKDLRARGLVRARGCALGFAFAPFAAFFFGAVFLERLTLAGDFLAGLRDGDFDLRAMNIFEGFMPKANETPFAQQDVGWTKSKPVVKGSLCRNRLMRPSAVVCCAVYMPGLWQRRANVTLSGIWR
jgi:hypothetical protein